MKRIISAAMLFVCAFGIFATVGNINGDETAFREGGDFLSTKKEIVFREGGDFLSTKKEFVFREGGDFLSTKKAFVFREGGDFLSQQIPNA